MSKTNSKQKPKAESVITELEARFLDGERLTVEQIIKEYFKTNQYSTYLREVGHVRGMLSQLKYRFTHIHGLWFGRLNDLGQYGVIESEEEAIFVITKYYHLVKGNIRRVVQVRDEAQAKGLLANVPEERILLPRIIENREEE